MKYLDIKIMEALKASQYRDLVKSWDKKRYADIFLNPKYKHDRNGYRVYIPIEDKFRPDAVQKSNIQTEIEKFLLDNDYEMVDYVKGLAKPLGSTKNPVRLGKLLVSLKRQDLLNKFNTDKNREGTKSTYMVVISRHPYDIGGMSTGRGWRSCMNLENGINRHYVPLDVKEGSVVAYVTRSDDLDLKSPSGRLLIKPFVDLLGKKVIYFGIESSIYGTDVPGFKEVVKQWVYEVNTAHELEEVAVLKFNPKLYPDSDLSTNVLVKGKFITPDIRAQIEQVKQNPDILLDIQNPADAVQLAALSATYNTRYIFSKLMAKADYMPSESVQRYVVTKDPDTINSILTKGITPSADVQLTAVSHDWRTAVKFIQNNIKMPDAVVEAAMEASTKIMKDLITAGYTISKSMLIKGLRSDGRILDQYFEYMMPVDLDVEIAAIENGYKNILKLNRRYTENNKKLPPELINAAVTCDSPSLIIPDILQHNKDFPDAAIELTEPQLLRAMITDRKGAQRDLWLDILNFETNLISEDGWLTFLTQTRASRYIVIRLLNNDKISQKSIKKLLHINGDLIELIEDPDYDDMVTAIKSNPRAISNVENPPAPLQELAVKLNPNVLGSISNPTLEVFKIAAAYKETNWNEDQDYGHLEVGPFLTSLNMAVDEDIIDQTTADALVKLLIKTEPRRIISLIQYGGFDITDELQQMAVDVSPNMVNELLDDNQIPSLPILVRYAKTHGNIGFIFDRLARINRTAEEKIELPDEFYFAYLSSPATANNASWLIRTATNSGFALSERVVNECIKLDPTAIVSALAYKVDVSEFQIDYAIQHGGVRDDQIDTFLSAIEQKYGEIPEKIYIALLDSNKEKEGHIVINFLNQKMWANRHKKELPRSVYKYAIKKDYRTILLIDNPDQELKDYNYEVNGYWQPLALGDLVRLSNPKAPPRHPIKKILGGKYVIDVNGKEQSFPKSRIHHANGITLPADYEKKQKLFAQKYPKQAALDEITVLPSQNGQVLDSEFQRVVKKHGFTEPAEILEIKNHLKHFNLKVVDAYSQLTKNDDDDDIFF